MTTVTGDGCSSGESDEVDQRSETIYGLYLIRCGVALREADALARFYGDRKARDRLSGRGYDLD